MNPAGRLATITALTLATFAGLVVGPPGARALDGDGTSDTVGAFDLRTARWYLRDHAGDTAVFTFGDPGDRPLVGDWDCDGFDSPGVYRPATGTVLLRNTATAGPAAVAFRIGDPGDVPVAGDFDGDGCDTVSLYRDGRVYLFDRLGAGGAGIGPADRVYGFGDPGDLPVAGDFDGDGTDEIGIWRPSSSRYHLTFGRRPGPADVVFTYGDLGDVPIAGAWYGEGRDLPALFRPRTRTFLLPAALGSGVADLSVLHGFRESVPVAGRFHLAGIAQPFDWAGAQLTVAVTGDILIHRTVAARAATPSGGDFDFGFMFAPVRGMIGAADLSLCHLEVPLTADGSAPRGWPLFRAPGQLAAAIASAGYDGCSVASNHSFDGGEALVHQTLDLLDGAGLGHAGTARSAEEADRITTYEPVAGTTVAHISATYSLNGLRLPPGRDWLVDLIDPAAISAEARRAKEMGADLVVVSLHWGDEYRAQPSAFQRSVAASLTAEPAIDVIVGHHAHVIQPIQVVNGTYVVYGLGNFLSGQRSVPRRDGVIVYVDFSRIGDRWSVAGIRYEPTWVAADYRILPADEPGVVVPSSVRAELAAAARRTAVVLMSAGAPGISPR